MAGQYDHLKGELDFGDKGWLPLDANGTPSGPATYATPPQSPDPYSPVLACAVMAATKEEVDEGDDALVTSTGAPITDHMISNVDNRPPGWEAPAPPTISALVPATCAIGDADFDLIVEGTGFDGESVIHFAGYDEPTTYNPEDGTLSTGIRPTLWQSPASIEVYIKNRDAISNKVAFDFTAPGRQDSTKRAAVEGEDHKPLQGHGKGFSRGEDTPGRGGYKDGDTGRAEEGRRGQEAGRGAAQAPGRDPKAPRGRGS